MHSSLLSAGFATLTGSVRRCASSSTGTFRANRSHWSTTLPLASTVLSITTVSLNRLRAIAPGKTSFCAYSTTASLKLTTDDIADAAKTNVSDKALKMRSLAQTSAFAARTGIAFDNPDILKLVMTHKSAHDQCNSRYQYLGETVLKTFVSEYVLAKYPLMEIDAASKVIEAYSSINVASNVGQIFGVHLLMRWKGNAGVRETPTDDGAFIVRASVMFALIGAVYQHQGPAAARNLIHKHFISRATDVDAILDAQLKISKPRKLLAITLKNLGKPKPISRLLGETGRLSARSVFLVGVYSGIEKIGDGYGSSIKMAEQRACIDALNKHYMTEVKNIKLPSETDEESEDNITFFESTPEQ
ncbi:hypothetical protein BASA50_010689 [Batrachochytrium salamandrivorans]|uniref:Large ribosomal subunit protein mL44 n=1 Tax=Batrachochytrium salamandrivorans TaxID=1357716 RepID=A0ABQ8EXU0_9FUNG|nr:hypothetical protein BASA62_003331 [Batrachochytrium salamandrivorans]KAH6588561.1 hypothetical protein BASA50_010689 [Batrachochytrium salamandrivorans]KAH9262116.1 hypothetical protein BASA83_013833 [Batrachochytrium salamandrivorans]